MSTINEKDAQIRAVKTLLGLMCSKCITERGIEEFRKFITELERERCALAGEPFEVDKTVRVKLKPKK